MKIRTLLFILNVFLALISLDLHAQHAVPSCNYTKNFLQVKNSTLKAISSKLKQVPESRQVIERALQRGSITVDFSFEGMPFAAAWLSSTREISIDGRNYEDQGKPLCYLLFELHNAISEPKYQKLYEMALNGGIGCDSYVEAVEKIEHENMINTVAILEKGISYGVFPQSARWEIIYDFATHYKIQQLTGHSLLIAKEYQDIKKGSAYRGTIQGLQKMSQREKMSWAEFLYTNYFRSRELARKA